MIYFLRAERDTPDFPAGSIKIGTTRCLTERLKQITKEIGHKPQVLAVMDGGLPEEYVLHQKFSECRIGRVSRGWFMPSDDLWKFIVNEARLWDETDDDPFEREVTLIRVTFDFSEAIREAASLHKMSVAEYATTFLLPVVQKEFPDCLDQPPDLPVVQSRPRDRLD